ncbi:MAG TPA: hypothetical protein PKY56_00195 [Candidatus Kapabacteria bacterium]|nr:hypothetical protein [Candidatus Kapabacteria bacterium]HPO62472.1 hypothetical protein [Candidatus Kapabacteria bacterium]
MKIFYFTLILFFISVSISFPNIVISERIGDEISPYERDYFFLLPSVKGFEKAVLIQDDTSYLFNISFKLGNDQKDTSIRITEVMLNDLKYYIEQYEKYVSFKDVILYNKMIKNIHKIVRPILSYETLEQIEWLDANNIIKKFNYLFYVGDFLVVTNTNNFNYNWKRPDNFIFIHYSEIQKILSPFLHIVGANKEFFEMIKSNLRSSFEYSNQIDSIVLPPELLSAYEKKKSEFANKELPSPLTFDAISNAVDNSFNFEISTRVMNLQINQDFHLIYSYRNQTDSRDFKNNDMVYSVFLNGFYNFQLSKNFSLNAHSSYGFPVQTSLDSVKPNYFFNAGIELVYGFDYVPNSFLFGKSEMFLKLASNFNLASYHYDLSYSSSYDYIDFKKDLNQPAISFDLSFLYQYKIVNSFFLVVEPKISYLHFLDYNQFEISKYGRKYYYKIENNDSFIPSLSLGLLYRLNL